MVIRTPFHVRGEFFCSRLYWPGSTATNLRRNLDEDVMSLLMCCPLVVVHGNQDEKSLTWSYLARHGDTYAMTFVPF